MGNVWKLMSYLLVGLLLLAACQCGDTEDISEACEANEICRASMESAQALSQVHQDWNTAMAVPMQINNKIETILEQAGPVERGIQIINAALSGLSNVGGVIGGIAQGLKTFLSILIDGPLTLFLSAINGVKKTVFGPASTLLKGLNNAMDSSIPALASLAGVLDLHAKFNESMSGMCLMPLIRDKLSPFITPLERCYEAAETALITSRKVAQDAIDALLTGYDAIMSSPVIQATLEILEDVGRVAEQVWKVFEPIVSKIVGAFQTVIASMDRRICIVPRFIFGGVCWRIKFSITALQVVTFLNGMFGSIMSLVRRIGFGFLVDTIDNLITKAVEGVVGVARALFGDLEFPLPLPSFPLDSLLDAIMNPVRPVLDQIQTLGKALDVVRPLQERLAQAYNATRDGLLKGTGLVPECFTGEAPLESPLECIARWLPDLPFNMEVPVDIEAMINKIQSINGMFSTLSDAILGCDAPEERPLCEFLDPKFAKDCISDIKIPMCPKLKFAPETTDEGRAMMDMMNNVSDIGYGRRRLQEVDASGFAPFRSWSMIVYPNVWFNSTAGQSAVSNAFTQWMKKKKQELPNNKWIDFGHRSTLQFFEWQFRMVCNFEGSTFKDCSFRPRIRAFKITYTNSWEVKKDWPLEVDAMLDYPLPRLPDSVGDNLIAARDYMAGQLTERILGGREFDFNALLSSRYVKNDWYNFGDFDTMVELSFSIHTLKAGPPSDATFFEPDRHGFAFYVNNGIFETGMNFRSSGGFNGEFQFPIGMSIMIPSVKEVTKFWPAEKTLKSIYNFLTRKKVDTETGLRKFKVFAFYYFEWIL
uniref:Uncharacterized protein n=1 Tax=Mucochytrium quahogii TaxID=96639 RepID=A0A7S2WJP6_9STRA|mmetsp:Transcript_25827/g.56125  ORF Transcript_25827/g.56125 Transcript_25827/m.56125 type:complete len:818 (+) Transcript_25827:63-2516(+)